MAREDEEAARAALEAEARSGVLLERLKAADVEREAQADPIYPDAEDVELEIGEAVELGRAFRSLRDDHRGELAVPRSVLPADPGRVASAIVVEAQSDLAQLRGRAVKARQHQGSEDLVDLQSFRPDVEVRFLLDDDVDPKVRTAALESLLTARAAVISWIRDDPSILGSINALRDLEIRVGDGRIALDAVNRYREHQAFGFLALIIIPVVAVVVIVLVIIVLIASGTV